MRFYAKWSVYLLFVCHFAPAYAEAKICQRFTFQFKTFYQLSFTTSDKTELDFITETKADCLERLKELEQHEEKTICSCFPSHNFLGVMIKGLWASRKYYFNCVQLSSTNELMKEVTEASYDYEDCLEKAENEEKRFKTERIDQFLKKEKAILLDSKATQ